MRKDERGRKKGRGGKESRKGEKRIGESVLSVEKGFVIESEGTETSSRGKGRRER